MTKKNLSKIKKSLIREQMLTKVKKEGFTYKHFFEIYHS